jgi:hypothetical protein
MGEIVAAISDRGKCMSVVKGRGGEGEKGRRGEGVKCVDETVCRRFQWSGFRV